MKFPTREEQRRKQEHLSMVGDLTKLVKFLQHIQYAPLESREAVLQREQPVELPLKSLEDDGE